MSFEVYVQSFENGEPSGMSRAIIRSTFGNFLSESEQDYWHVSYGPGESCALALSALADSTEQIHNITIERPCADHRLWQGLAALLAIGNTVLYFPGCSGPLVRDMAVAPHMPSDMLATLGRPIVVCSGADLVEHVSAA